MPDSTEIDAVVSANVEYARDYRQGSLPPHPARHLVILTCMDARMRPDDFLGLHPGDAHVVRNAGGRASDDAIRSLIISSRLLGTRECAVIHHTDCGMQTFTNRELQDRLAQETGEDASGIDFLPFSDLERSVREDVRRIKASPFVPSDFMVQGFVFDVKTGALSPVADGTE